MTFLEELAKFSKACDEWTRKMTKEMDAMKNQVGARTGTTPETSEVASPEAPPASLESGSEYQGGLGDIARGGI